MDDNVSGWKGVPREYWNEDYLPAFGNPEIRRLYTADYTARELLDVVAQTVQRAVAIGANYAGFASNTNPGFREKHWRDVAFIDHKASLVYAGAVRMNPMSRTKEDHWTTANALLDDGCVVRNEFTKPVTRHYEDGGATASVGGKNARERLMVAESKRLISAYPDLWRYTKQHGRLRGGHVTLRVRNRGQVEEWRELMRATGRNGKGVHLL